MVHLATNPVEEKRRNLRPCGIFVLTFRVQVTSVCLAPVSRLPVGILLAVLVADKGIQADVDRAAFVEDVFENSAPDGFGQTQKRGLGLIDVPPRDCALVLGLICNNELRDCSLQLRFVRFCVHSPVDNIPFR